MARSPLSRLTGLLLGGLTGLLALVVIWALRPTPRPSLTAQVERPRSKPVHEPMPLPLPLPAPAEPTAAEAEPSLEGADAAGTWLCQGSIVSRQTGRAPEGFWVYVTDASVDLAGLRGLEWGKPDEPGLLEQSYPVVTESSGEFRFRCEPPEHGAPLDFHVLAGAPGHGLAVQTFQAWSPHSHLGKIYLKSGASLTGQVLDGLGWPLAGVSISVHAAATSINLGRLYSDESGGFHFHDLPAGIVRLSVGRAPEAPDDAQGDFCGGVVSPRKPALPVVASNRADGNVYDPTGCLLVLRLVAGESHEVEVGGLHQLRLRWRRDAVEPTPEPVEDGLSFDDAERLCFALPRDGAPQDRGLSPWSTPGARFFLGDDRAGWMGLGSLASGRYLVGNYDGFQDVGLSQAAAAPVEIEMRRRTLRLLVQGPEGREYEGDIVALPERAALGLASGDPAAIEACWLAALGSRENTSWDAMEGAEAGSIFTWIPAEGDYLLVPCLPRGTFPVPPLLHYPPPGTAPVHVSWHWGRPCQIRFRRRTRADDVFLTWAADTQGRIVALGASSAPNFGLFPGRYRIHALSPAGVHLQRDLTVPSIDGPPLVLHFDDAP